MCTSVSPVTHPVVPCLVLVVDPVEGFHAAVLDAVFGDPLISITAALAQDPRHHLHLLQVDLDPLVQVVKLGQPCTPDANTSFSFIFKSNIIIIKGSGPTQSPGC